MSAKREDEEAKVLRIQCTRGGPGGFSRSIMKIHQRGSPADSHVLENWHLH